MDAAFLLTVSSGDSLDSRAHAGIGPRPDRHLVGFEVGSHHRWTDRSGRLAVEVWGASGGAEPWHLGSADASTTGGIAAVAGQPWWRGPAWSEPREWARQMWKHGARTAPADLRRKLGGVHVSLRITDDGDGWVSADPLGQRCLYVAERGDLLYVGSRAALVAAAADAGRPVRDAWGTAWLAFMGFRAGRQTGFEGVQHMPSNTALALSRGTVRWDVEEAVVLPEDHESHRRPLEEHAEAVLDELGTAMRAVLDRSTAGHVIQLSGGKDSRVMLAAALRAGVAHDFTFETIGPPKLDDVVLAKTLTERFGLRHDVRFIGLASTLPYDERARDFVDHTAAGLNLWDIDGRIGKGEIRLTGVCGAALRASARLPAGDPETVLRGVFDRARYDRLGVLMPDVADALHADLLADVLAPAGHSTSAHDRLQAWYVATEPKYSRLAARLEIQGDLKLPVLASWPVVRASSSIDPLDRQDHVLVAEALRQVSRDLVDIAFTDAGWPPRARAHLDGVPPPPPSPPRPRRPEPSPPASAPAGTRRSGAGSKSISLAKELGGQMGERVRFLGEVFADAANPAWGLFDRTTALEALSRYQDLANIERKAIFGVATAAVWLDG